MTLIQTNLYFLEHFTSIKADLLIVHPVLIVK